MPKNSKHQPENIGSTRYVTLMHHSMGIGKYGLDHSLIYETKNGNREVRRINGRLKYESGVVIYAKKEKSWRIFNENRQNNR